MVDMVDCTSPVLARYQHGPGGSGCCDSVVWKPSSFQSLTQESGKGREREEGEGIQERGKAYYS